MDAQAEPQAVRGVEELRGAIADAKFLPEDTAVRRLLESAPYSSQVAKRIEDSATKLVAEVRANRGNRTLLDDFLHEYGLKSQEGIALLCLAEALLRIPDPRTADQLIADKVVPGEWSAHLGHGEGWLVHASTWALLLTGKVAAMDEKFRQDPITGLQQLIHRLGEPAVRQAMRYAMRVLGDAFVLGQTIEQAIERSEPGQGYSYDMLGEGARDAETAVRYQDDYLNAIDAAAKHNAVAEDGRTCSVSIKLSALHPRYEASKRRRVLEELGGRLRFLCKAAAENGVEITLDAEEADRLDLSLDLFGRMKQDPALKDWPGLGMAVQAYGKRAPLVIDWLRALAQQSGHRIPVRLVKGAYWDSEIKKAQAAGYAEFPVYTRKASTDLSYLVCAKKLLDYSGDLLPQFATHNAHTLATVMALAADRRDFEFQRLHGMGVGLYREAPGHFSDFPLVRVYAPVGVHEDLLPYLIRRLLENGANSSFVHRLRDEQLDPRVVVQDPISMVEAFPSFAHPNITLPPYLFGPERINSKGLDLSNLRLVEDLQDQGRKALREPLTASPIVCGEAGGGEPMPVVNPANTEEIVGESWDSKAEEVERAFASASSYQPTWDAIGVEVRAGALEAFADQLEENRARLAAILGRESGKTIPDSVAEVREAVDFCRYYACEARTQMSDVARLPGTTGESNALSLHGRGVFVCISPWNFPLAIFTGQIAAALVTGNTVLAKPAEETPLIAFEAVRLMHAAGVPKEALHLLPGDGEVGAQLTRHANTAGVAFTGSTQTAHRINQTLAARAAPIAPLIAETGGQNVMIADSTALLEQLTDHVIQSAFLSAGQRCSALRVLYLQEEIADKAIHLICGAMDELQIGDPTKIETDVGPIISEEAAKALRQHVDAFRKKGALLHEAALPEECGGGHFVAPCAIELKRIDELDTEHFGPILHVIRFSDEDLDRIVEDVVNTGFGLTLGIHSRIEAKWNALFSSIPVGNTYVNRNMVGAVVESQPFGGQGLSGTGPKAGGPHYLPRFMAEKVLTVNTAAAGGNPALFSKE